MSTTLPLSLLRTDARYCRPCDRDVVSKPRLRFAGLGIASIALLVLVLIGFSALIGPFIMFTVPFILLAGFAIGPMVSLATAPPECPHCHRELIYVSRPHRARRIERAAAREDVMKAA